MTEHYPYCPKCVDVFWDNGRYVAIVTDRHGTRRNVAGPYAHTKREAIFAARDYLETQAEACVED